jgi:hypothetical protein
MSSSLKGICPVCRANVQVKNFKRHWNTQHQRHEKKRTYDETFNTLKANILDQDKATTTSSIDTFFENKKRQKSDDTQSVSITTIIQQSFVPMSDDNIESSDPLSPSLSSSDIQLGKINNNTYKDDMLILLQIFEDIFVQLENEKRVIHTSSLANENDGTTSTDNLVVDLVSPDMIENENPNDNDVLMSLNDLITHIASHNTNQGECFSENDNATPFISSIINISDSDTSEDEKIGNNETCCSSTDSPINRPPCIKVSLPGVQFITDWELKFVDEQRLLLKDNAWLPNGFTGKSKPSRTWFTEIRSTWLRAVYSEKKYGLLCIVCAKEAKCESRLIRNQGSFISHPYWKLLHKGLDGNFNY